MTNDDTAAIVDELRELRAQVEALTAATLLSMQPAGAPRRPRPVGVVVPLRR